MSCFHTHFISSGCTAFSGDLIGYILSNTVVPYVATAVK